MIPTIEDIVAGLLAQQYTHKQAVGWLYAQVENEGLRDAFASAALQGMLADLPKTLYGIHWQANVAQAAYEVADAMLQERSK